jgi:murein DD-endopeptidase MepM/ murein hydrolase activator NlpD
MELYKNLHMTSDFDYRKNPITNIKEFHRGLDFRPNIKKDVYAGFSGMVRIVSTGDREGNYIQLLTKLNRVQFYINIFHLQEIKRYIRIKHFVRPDDIIAEAGNTGNSTAIHIHYEISTYKLKNQFINELTKNLSYFILEREKRIFFNPIELYNYCVNNKIYV